MKKIYLISFCFFLTVFCATIIQSCKKNDELTIEAKPQGKLLDDARAWFKEQSLLSPSPDSNDIQLSSFKPDWNKFKVIKNAGGTDVIGIPLETKDDTYMEIDYFKLNERNFGIIKKYNWVSKEMMIYSGTGRLQQKALYYPATQKVGILESVSGVNTLKLAFEDMYYLPEVTINGGSTYTPPPPPPSYTFPPAPVYNPYPYASYYYYQYQQYQYQQYQGNGSTPPSNSTPTYANDISNQVKSPPLRGLVDALRFSDVTGMIRDIISKLDKDKKVTLTFVDAKVTTKGGPAETSNRTTNAAGEYSATITLSTDILLQTSKECATAVIVHEIIHAYFGYDLATNSAWFEHEKMATKYVNPMASFLQSTFGMSNKDAVALSWTGLSDAPSYIQDSDFSYTIPTTNGPILATMTKDVMTDIYQKYVIKALGTPVTQ